MASGLANKVWTVKEPIERAAFCQDKKATVWWWLSPKSREARVLVTRGG